MTAIQEPTLATVLELLERNIKNSLFAHLPATIMAYDPTTQIASVKPMVMTNTEAEDGSTIIDQIPIIYNVPVMMPRSEDMFINLPVKVGDYVMLAFQDRSIEGWINSVVSADPVTASPSDPQDVRAHDLSDCVALPGLYPITKPLATASALNLNLGHDTGKQIHIKPTGTIALGSEVPGDFVALASKVLTELQNIATDINNLKSVWATYGATPVLPDPVAQSAADTVFLKSVGSTWSTSPVTPSTVASAVVESE